MVAVVMVVVMAVSPPAHSGNFGVRIQLTLRALGNIRPARSRTITRRSTCMFEAVVASSLGRK